MEIKRDDPDKRRQFRATHNCDSPGPKDKARYWSCKMWSKKNVSDILGKAETMTTVKTESLKKTNDHINDIMRMIKHGVYITKTHEQFFELVERGLYVVTNREIKMSERPKAEETSAIFETDEEVKRNEKKKVNEFREDVNNLSLSQFNKKYPSRKLGDTKNV